MDYACIYNPRLGDEDQIEDQLVFKYGDQPTAVFIKAIGVAQGIAEVAYSFDSNPVTHIQTGTQLIIVQKLEAERDNNEWQSGYWLTCALDSTKYPNVDCEVLRMAIARAYRVWRLKFGEFAASELDQWAHDWWSEWCNTFMARSKSLLIPDDYVSRAPGTLNPATLAYLDQGHAESGAAALLITSSDGSFSRVWKSDSLDHETCVDLQLWLKHGPSKQKSDMLPKPAEISNDESESSTIGTTPAVLDSAETTAEVLAELPGEPLPEGRLPGSYDSEDNESIEPINTILEPETEQENVTEPSTWSLSNFVPAMPAMPSMPTMSMPSMSPAMNLPAMPSMSLPTIPSTWFAKKVEAETKESTPAPTYGDEDVQWLDYGREPLRAGGKRLSPVICVRRTFLYVFLFEQDPFEEDTHPCRDVVARTLGPHLEGLGFAAAPPTKFFYLVLNHSEKRAMSTFPVQLDPTVASCVRSMAAPNLTECVQRTNEWWLAAAPVPEASGARIVFGKSLTGSKMRGSADMLEQLHKDTRRWLQSFHRYL